MKNQHVLPLLCLSVLVLGLFSCSSIIAEGVPSLGAGFRYSTYGVQGNPPAEYWVSVGNQISEKFPVATPETIWIVGNIYGEGTYLNFPCEAKDPLIKCGFIDMNEEMLLKFDEQGFRVWLQVEPGNANMDELIDIVLDHYGHHPSVVGFGLDVEWYKSPDGPLGVPITDEEARHWVKKTRTHNPEYFLFLKHWEIEWMPPSEREGILFINDRQSFESLADMLEQFSAWGEHFNGYPVGFQFGYPSDRNWWGAFADPVGEVGNAILDRIANTKALYWVDFTLHEVFPPTQ
jgi:hypothetical protein